MARKPGLPLRVDHRSYIRSLEGPELHQAWKQFTDAFWAEAGQGLPERADFLFQRGFLADRWDLYGFDTADPESCLSDFQMARLNQGNGIYAPVLEDRMLMIHALSGYCAVPPIHALRGLKADQVGLSAAWQAHADGRPDAPPLEIRIQPLLARARARSATVTLRDGQFEGLGRSGSLARLSAIVRDWSEAADLPYLFTGLLPQGEFLTALYPPGRSHLSVLLTRDLNDWSPRLVAACAMIDSDRARAGPDRGELRLGGGALSAPVDPASGRLGRAISFDASGPQRRYHDRHPDSGARIAGAVVPGWDGIRARLLRIMDECSYIRVAFLDFTLTSGERLGLLGPAPPDPAPLQVHRPLLDDPVLAETVRREVL